MPGIDNIGLPSIVVLHNADYNLEYCHVPLPEDDSEYIKQK